MHPLDGVRLKVDRAKEHFNALADEVERFIEAEPYSFVMQPHPTEASAYIIFAKINHIPPLRWSVVIGDSIQNARSALDHLVYQLAKLNVADPQGTQFPIIVNPKDYASAEKRNLTGVDARHKAVIKGLQPCYGGDQALAILADLNNTDKHRVIQLVGAAGQFRFLEVQRPFGTSSQMELQTINQGIIAEDGAPVAILRGEAIMNVQVSATIDIEFGEGSNRAKGHEVSGTIKRILDVVQDITRQFEPDFP